VHNIDGQNGFTKEDLFSITSTDKYKIINPPQKVHITHIVSRRLPDGLHYYIVLTTIPERKVTFDYRIFNDGLTYDDAFRWDN
jgi:hypothetical protein